MKKELIRRDFKVGQSQIREMEDGKRTIEGFIPYNSRSEYMGFFEYISPTAFNKTLADGADVRCLYNHDDSKLLGRVKNGSLRLESREDGLHIECDLPDTSYAEDAYNLIRGGYNNGLSFGMYILKEDYGEEDGVETHILREVRLLEVSFAVSFPAYEATGSKARSLIEELSDCSEEELKEIYKKAGELLPKEETKPVDETDTSVAKNTEDAERDKQLDSYLAELKAM